MPTFQKRREFIEKRVQELCKFNYLKTRVVGPFPQRLNVHSKEHFEIYKKFSQAGKYSQREFLNQMERKKLQNRENIRSLSPQLEKSILVDSEINGSFISEKGSIHSMQKTSSAREFPKIGENRYESIRDMDEAIRSLSPLNRMTIDQIK